MPFRTISKLTLGLGLTLVRDLLADRLLQHLARVTSEALEAELGEISLELQNRLRDLGY